MVDTGTSSEMPSTEAGRLLRVLLSITTLALAAAAIAALGWLRSAQRSVTLEELSESDRQRLAEDLEGALPGVYEPAWYQPEIGYTLRPSSRLEAWGDSFESNELGYRTGPLAKSEGTFRVLLLGDSWTFGLGVREQESFPKAFERLANQHAGIGQRVEAWALALPSYNSVNQVAALDFFFDRLEPDAVAFVPSANDNQSSYQVLPSGRAHAGSGARSDWFGDPHPLHYEAPCCIDSFRYLDRWRFALGEVRDSALRLAQIEIPTFTFFVARWRLELAHLLTDLSRLPTPYAVVPAELTLGRWRGDSQFGHGSTEAYELYAQLLYRLVGKRLDWKPLPASVLHEEIVDLPLFDSVPAAGEWKKTALALLKSNSARYIPTRYEVGAGTREQWPGPGSFRTGVIGRSTTVLIRPARGTTSLRVALERLPDLRSLYPLGVEVRIPSPTGAASRRVTVPAQGPERVEIEVPVPADLRDGTVLDVVVLADRVTARGETRVAASVRIALVEAF